ncbi:FAD-dependent oxidoreductase [Anaeromassilibacillus sp. An200]|uniref:FAD-dependent oxidoreductase n=1 Tax=Anaeromassilibacillus sp. An200 TaxID=1965587 RepID=UPI0013A615C3|nr:FAD-dependent oxidoreductase [Anaeromassilibacillus sp. An200]
MMLHRAQIETLVTHTYETELCIVGGGMAGMIAAIAAARHGRKVVLMQDRPVLGGNASSEIRMWIRGAHGANMRETGILEEIALENIYRNPTLNFSVWDSVLFGKVKCEKNITLLLNCSCLSAETRDGKIVSVTGWQTTTQTYHTVRARLFADCSGDSILAPLTGAEWRMGRESCEEFGEDIAPQESDARTMGMSCLLQVRETARPTTYIPPAWAYHFEKKDFENKINFSTPQKWNNCNFWWMELGGLVDSIADTETMRDELIRTVYGVWDFVKNGGVCDAANWEIEWIGFLPGKRESRRYVGDYLLNQNDVRAEGKFDDLIAYGGWTMDDHHPAGFLTTEPPTIWHPAPSPYGIPYRCLYSKNVENLMFAGRNISATHTALSSTRVMATCAIMGQALGTAVAIALRDGLTPRGVYEQRMQELKQTLIADDCYLPWNRREPTPLMESVRIEGAGDVSLLTDGVERPVDGVDHAYVCEPGQAVVFTLPEPRFLSALRIVMDSDLNRETFPEGIEYSFKTFPMKCHVRLGAANVCVPKTILRAFDVYADGERIATENENYQRLVRVPIGRTVREVRFVPRETWGCSQVRLYALELMA